MNLRVVLIIVMALFPVSEVGLAIVKRANARTSHVEDRGSMRLLWLVIAASLCLAIAFEWVPGARLPLSPSLLQGLALVLLLAGLVIRWVSILTLGRLFTVNVAIQADHTLVHTGLYRFVRHPSYAGLLLSFLGLGVSFGNWLSLLVLVLPVAGAVFYRIATEERALRQALGTPYAKYCQRTKRLIPRLL